jgi:hypothetical protein
MKCEHCDAKTGDGSRGQVVVKTYPELNGWDLCQDCAHYVHCESAEAAWFEDMAYGPPDDPNY